MSASRLELPVRFCETDLMGIVHHATYLVYFEAGRVDYLHKRGVSYEQWLKRGLHLPVVEARARYRRPAKFDDLLTVETQVAACTRVTCTWEYRVHRGAELMCEGHTLLCCVGDDLAPRRIPDDVAAVLRSDELPPEQQARPRSTA